MSSTVYGAIVGGIVGLIFGWIPAGCLSGVMTFGSKMDFSTILLLFWSSLAFMCTGIGAGLGYLFRRFGDE